MPNPLGDMDADEYQKAVDWLVYKWGEHKPCPMHNPARGGAEWFIPTKLVRPISAGYVQGGPNEETYPMVMVVCRICGYTAFVNAVMARIVSPKDA